MQFTKSARCLLVAAGLAAASMTTTASAQTAFTYQGVLEEGGSPVTGLESIRFRIYDAPTGGTLFGETTQNVDVTDGVFAAELNFGTLDTINPASAWLEIAVSTGPGTFETLGRQTITAAPFAANTRGLNVDSSGRLSVGTTSHSDILHIAGTNARILTESTGGFFSGVRSRVAGKEFFTGVDTFPGAANGGAGWHVFDNTGAGRLLALLPNGNFGIGVSIPQARLDVAGGALFDANVGIGTDTPDRALVVRSNSGVMLGLEGPSSPGLRIASDNSNALGTSWSMFQDSASGDLIFRDSFDGITRMAIDSVTGNVGIGNTDPNFPLTIESDSAGNSIGLRSNAGGSDWHFDFGPNNLDIVESGVASRITLNDGGGVFVNGGNVNVPGRTIFGTQFGGVSATTQIFGRNSETFAMVVGDPTGIFRLSVNNNGAVATQCGIICASDERLKNDIANLESPLDKIMALRSVTFTWKDETLAKRGTQLGFVAQEVQQVLPELIGETPDGMLGVDYASLTSVLTGAVQEQQAEIESMQAQIAALQAQMESLQSQRSMVGASMVWPVLLGGGIVGGLAVIRRRHISSANKA